MVEYAGFWRRFAAWIIDSIIVTVGSLIIGFIIGLILGIALINLDEITKDSIIYTVSFIVGFIIPWLYFALMESSDKQATLGKMTLKIKVTDLDGNRISFGRASARYWSKLLSGFILCIGYFMAGWTKRKQALHDMIAGCLVVKDS
jgi:uncharacterized RDD family membrane protein YckC